MNVSSKFGPSFLSALPALMRIILSASIAFSAFMGYYLTQRSVDLHACAVFVGIALLSGGASALNQVQERQTDALMARTMLRPIPRGVITVNQAIFMGTILSCLGILILCYVTTWLAVILSLVNFIWYVGVYTPLKRVSVFAVLIGAVTGALPPLIGCAAATGTISAYIVWVGAFMFLWQVPHFLLLLLKYGKEYEDAGIPTIMKQVPLERVKLIIFVWFFSTAAVTFMFAFSGVISSLPILIVLTITNVLFIGLFAWNLCGQTQTHGYGVVNRILYAFQVFVWGLLVWQVLL